MMSPHTRGLTCLLMIEHACSSAQTFIELFIASEALQLRSEKSLLLWLARWAEKPSVKQDGRQTGGWMLNGQQRLWGGNYHFIQSFPSVLEVRMIQQMGLLGNSAPEVTWQELDASPSLCSSLVLHPLCSWSCCCCCQTEASTGISGHRICWLSCSFSQA